MELKKFRNKYDLELIPASNENIILGDLVWDPLTGAPQFDHPGMPESIFNSFIDAQLVSQKEWKKFLNDSKKEKIVDAHLAESSLDVDLSIATTLGYPTIGKIDQNFELKKISKFSFSDLQVRTMSNLTRIRIDNYLELLKKNKWKSKNMAVVTATFMFQQTGMRAKFHTNMCPNDDRWKRCNFKINRRPKWLLSFIPHQFLASTTSRSTTTVACK